MKDSEARHILEGEAFTFTHLRRLLNNGKSDELSSTCSFFSKADVREMILLAINGKRGVIDPKTTMAKFALWGLVEFG